MSKFSAATPALFFRSSRLALLGVASAVIFSFAGPSAATAATVVVDVGGAEDKFIPDSVNINVGDTVMWVWQSDGHSVTEGGFGNPSPDFDSGVIDTPNTFSHTFTAPGTVDYHCKPHFFMGMVGTVNVAGATTHADAIAYSVPDTVSVAESISKSLAEPFTLPVAVA